VRRPTVACVVQTDEHFNPPAVAPASSETQPPFAVPLAGLHPFAFGAARGSYGHPLRVVFDGRELPLVTFGPVLEGDTLKIEVIEEAQEAFQTKLETQHFT